jgi:GH18 family chitinase
VFYFCCFMLVMGEIDGYPIKNSKATTTLDNTNKKKDILEYFPNNSIKKVQNDDEIFEICILCVTIETIYFIKDIPIEQVTIIYFFFSLFTIL